MMIRSPAVAGRFYPQEPKLLQQNIRDFLIPEPEPQRAWGIISPHAGYVYSGGVAGATFSKIKIPDHLIVLCPNHTGRGAWAAINAKGKWRTPLGDMAIDETLAQQIMELHSGIEEDQVAHVQEHALEVQLPFLQVLNPQAQMLPLCLSHFSFEECARMGRALGQIIENSENEILMVASSDMNHYENQERTLAKDERAIEAILALDPEQLYQRVHDEHISMCGIIPVTCMLLAANQLGAKEATLVQHCTSGDVSGDYAGVVGYAGMVIR